MKRKKILFISPFFATYAKRDLEILKKYHSVRILCYTKRKDLFQLLQGILWADIIFSWFAFTYSAIAALLARILGKKSIVIVAGGDIANIPELNYGLMRIPLSRFKVRLSLRLSSKVIVASEFLKKQILRYVTPKDIKIIPYGIDCDRFKPGNQKKENQVITVSIGVEALHIKLKGLETFVEAAKYLPDIKFILVGGLFDEAGSLLKSQAPPNVIFTGFIPNDDLIRYYQSSKVYCQLSKYEGIANAVLEAMACGCVPVVSNEGGSPEAVGDIGFLVNYGDPQGTAEAIKKAINAEDKTILARERIKRLFEKETRVKGLILAINEL